MQTAATGGTSGSSDGRRAFAHNDARSPEWKKIYADMRNFQRDQILWFRFAEARYDTFMSAQKI